MSERAGFQATLVRFKDVLSRQLALLTLHETLQLRVHGVAVSDASSFSAFMGHVALGNLLLRIFGVELLGGADKLARVRHVARAHNTSLLAVVLVEGMQPLRTLDVLEHALAARQALVAAALTDKAKLEALERDADLGGIIRKLGVPLGEAKSGLYMRGTSSPMPESKVGVGGSGQDGTVDSRATQKQQGGGSAMVAFRAPLPLEQVEPEDGRGTFDELNHLCGLMLEGFEALLTLSAGGAGCLHAVSMAGSPRSDPSAAGETCARARAGRTITRTR